MSSDKMTALYKTGHLSPISESGGTLTYLPGYAILLLMHSLSHYYIWYIPWHKLWWANWRFFQSATNQYFELVHPSINSTVNWSRAKLFGITWKDIRLWVKTCHACLCCKTQRHIETHIDKNFHNHMTKWAPCQCPRATAKYSSSQTERPDGQERY